MVNIVRFCLPGCFVVGVAYIKVGEVGSCPYV